MNSSTFYFILAIIPSIVIHEVSHGWVANFFGDPTAKEAHRLTLNPLRHIDPFGTVLLPALLIFSGLPAFGYAKPVPVTVTRLRKPRSQSFYVSLAGPFVNIVMSGMGFLMAKYGLHHGQSFLLNFGISFGLVNITLAAFNLLPIPPLDGSALIERFIPTRSLPRYYYFRAKAIPFVMVLVVLDGMFFHVGTSWLNDLQNWWFNHLVQ